MPNIQNSEVVMQVLTKLMDISRRKTNEGHAIYVMNSLIKKLVKNYDFLENVEIKDTRYMEDSNSVSVMSNINSVAPDKVGKALRSIVLSMNETLGKNAGHFMIRELRNGINDEYHSTMMDNMGLDLSLLQLEYEVSKMEHDLDKK